MLVLYSYGMDHFSSLLLTKLFGMKKYVFLLAALFFSFSLFSFTDKKGGDVFEVYLNGKQVHQQFVHADKSAKNIHLTSFRDNDKIEIFYSHCGQTGKNRTLTIRNEKNEVVKVFRFADDGNRSRMAFSRKDIGKLRLSTMNLYYSSIELPTAKMLASIQWTAEQSVAKR